MKLTPASTPPQTVTQNVFGELVALAYTISDKQNRKQLDDAIDRLSKSLKHELWIDPSHPNPKKGEKVFEDQKEAVKKLLDLIKDKKSTVPDAPLQGFVDRLVKADRDLATIAISDAQQEVQPDQKKIAKANAALAEGDAAAVGGKPDKAIDDYKKAWKDAQKA